jgi:phage repressor protein C with HTH and peptisase S24 domain
VLTHKQVWAALDALAARYAMSPSGLAKAAGLDPTTFNRSKRVALDGKLRWPSTESIAKALAATGASIEDFSALMAGASPRGESRYVPLLRLAQVSQDNTFDESGLPSGEGWERIAFPDLAEAGAYAIEITGDAFEPLYQAGDRILLAPRAELRRGDRALAKSKGGEVTMGTVTHITATHVALRLPTGDEERSLERAGLAFLHRVIWSSE